MPDDITLSAAVGVGKTVGADDIANVFYQRIKLIFGNDGINEGDVSSSTPLPVEIKKEPVQVESENLIWGDGTVSVTVGASDTPVLAANASRTGAIFTNDSSNVIYLRLGGSAAALNTGIRLNANGGAYEISNINKTTLEIRAIATAAGSNLCVQEAT